MYQIPRNALALMLVAQTLVILPHVVRLPVWITLLCLVCGLWRIQVFLGRWSYPGKLVKVLFVLGAFLGVGFGFGTLLGLEPWVGILILAFVLKLLEMHQPRDAYTVIILAYFVALTEFLFEQSIPYTLYMYVCVTFITAALIGVNQSNLSISARATVKKASIMLLQSIPLMLVLFLLFPRIAPLWTVPLQSNIAKTGVSDRMSPGSIAELVQSDELAFRATFENEIPPYGDLYWRGLVFSKFEADTQTWLQETAGAYGRPQVRENDVTSWSHHLEYVGDPVKYSIIMEPTQRNWMFSLTLPKPTGSQRVGLVRDGRFYNYREIGSRFRYELTSYLDFRLEEELSDFWRYRNTLLPANDNPQTKALAQSMRAGSSSDEEFMIKVMRLYATDYAYTLRPPTVKGHSIDEFLLSTKRGFCEHFAGSFVYLMRAGGVPARVVVGYQGGEYNSRGNYVAVHQFDAHAWAEVWFQDRGWVRVDPTSVVAPERTQRGLESAVEGEETFLADVGLSLMKFRSTLWITELRLQVSALNHYWDAFVVGYTPDVQMSLLTRFFGEVDKKTIGMILVGSFFGLLFITALFLLVKRSDRKLAPVEREYLRFCKMLHDENVSRLSGEGPMTFSQRASVARPDLAPAIKAVTRAYIKANFIDDQPDDAQELRKAVRNMRVRVFA
jgi:transglutaminase-like putative cysteine protease